MAALDLPAVVEGSRPTILVGLTGRSGAFTEDVVRRMCEHCARPVIFPLSNPTSKAEATPADLIRWSRGTALVATGSPFPPVEFGGVTYRIGQANNVLAFPGVGLGAVAVAARSLPDEAFLAAAHALSEIHDPSSPGEPLFPPLHRLRETSHAVAAAVAKTLLELGVAPPLGASHLEERLASLVWEPVYLPYRLEDDASASRHD